MSDRNYIAEVKGRCGITIRVFRSESGYGFVYPNGEGMAGHSLDYIKDYLREVESANI